MIKFISKYYLKFPPLARTTINVSLSGLIGGIGVDYYRPDTENILLACDELMNKKLFV